MYEWYPTNMKSHSYSADLKLALKLADYADAITTKSFGMEQKVDIKADKTPVTDVDTAVERTLRNILAKERPLDTVIGEEYGGNVQSNREWIIDPIDGTKNYMRGNPFYATLIALREGTQTIVAVVSAPMLDRRWWATHNGGAWRNGQKLHVSDTAELNSAYLTFSSLGNWRKTGMFDDFLTLYESCGRQRAFGDFYNFMLLAEGAVDIVVEPTGLSIWDVAAPQLIIEEAGGICTSLRSNVDFDGSILATNSLELQSQVRKIVN